MIIILSLNMLIIRMTYLSIDDTISHQALQERPAARPNLPLLIGGAVVVVGVATVLVLRNQQK